MKKYMTIYRRTFEMYVYLWCLHVWGGLRYRMGHHTYTYVSNIHLCESKYTSLIYQHLSCHESCVVVWGRLRQRMGSSSTTTVYRAELLRCTYKDALLRCTYKDEYLRSAYMMLPACSGQIETANGRIEYHVTKLKVVLGGGAFSC